jgi:hypothetical protein
LSNAADAPYLGEAAILYMLTVQPAPGVTVVTGGGTPRLVWLCLAVYFGVPAVTFVWLARAFRRRRRPEVKRAALALGDRA